MEINEEFARYILGVQDIAMGERGEAEQDIRYMQAIFEAFPKIKEEKEWEEFTEWLWSEEVEKNPNVESLRSRLRQIGRSASRPAGENEFNKLLGELDALKDSIFIELRDARREEMLRKFKVTKAVEKMTKEK